MDEKSNLGMRELARNCHLQVFGLRCSILSEHTYLSLHSDVVWRLSSEINI